uniref:Uncharacterized protein n=1 Tax=Xiphophorus couchianus TaxID=32473 RepID=A0A3B5M2T5_9TELE
MASMDATLEEQTKDGDTALTLAAEANQVENIKLLLRHGASPHNTNSRNESPLVLRTLIPVTTKRAIRLSGQSPVHSAADGGQTECLELLIQNGFDINTQLDKHISENYGDLRKTPLYFAVSNGDVTGAEILLKAGARTDLDPLRCILVAVRAERYELVKLLLSYGAEVNCYFRVINNTAFPTALYYCLRDHDMLRLLLNSGYQAHKRVPSKLNLNLTLNDNIYIFKYFTSCRCFQCFHNESEDLDSTWTDLHNQAYKIYCQPNVIPVRTDTPAFLPPPLAA